VKNCLNKKLRSRQ